LLFPLDICCFIARSRPSPCCCCICLYIEK
jgi:hypothetical protein